MSMNWYRENGSDEWDSFVQACHEAMEDPEENEAEEDDEDWNAEDAELEWIETRRNMIHTPDLNGGK